MSVPSYPNDPGYQDPGNGQPLYPTLSDYPNRTRFGSSPANRFRPVVGKRPKPPKATASKVKATKPAKAVKAAKAPKPGKTQAGPTRAAGLSGGGDLWNKLVEARAIVDSVGNELYWSVIVPKALGAGYGYSNGKITYSGHHPQATGGVRSAPDLAHHGLSRRAIILSYNSGTQTAVVRDADAADSPPYSVRVSPAVTGAIGSASEAGLALWDTGDPNDLLISTVL